MAKNVFEVGNSYKAKGSSSVCLVEAVFCDTITVTEVGGSRSPMVREVCADSNYNEFIAFLGELYYAEDVVKHKKVVRLG